VPRRQHLSALTEHPPPAGDTPREDPLRRVALVVTAVVLPLVLALVVLVQVLGPDEDDDTGGSAVAEVDGSAPPQRADLPPLPVEVPPVTPEADASCPGLMSGLPLELAGEASRPVQSDTPYAYAWGDPPVVLVCGVERPAGFVVGTGLIQINGVQWYVDTSDPDAIVWTAVDRPVYVQVTVSPDTDSAPVTLLGPVINDALPVQEPDPAG
jgi:hypothetical protein